MFSYFAQIPFHFHYRLYSGLQIFFTDPVKDTADNIPALLSVVIVFLQKSSCCLCYCDALLSFVLIICDSSYTFAAQPPIVRTDKVTAAEGSEVCYVSVNFPSREPKVTRSIVETIEPFIAKDGDETLWEFRAYITNADGKITESVLSLRQPLRAGQLKIIKAYVTGEGAVQTDDHTVGVSVQLNWSDGGQHDVEL